MPIPETRIYIHHMFLLFILKLKGFDLKLNCISYAFRMHPSMHPTQLEKFRLRQKPSIIDFSCSIVRRNGICRVLSWWQFNYFSNGYIWHAKRISQCFEWNTCGPVPVTTEIIKNIQITWFILRNLVSVICNINQNYSFVF